MTPTQDITERDEFYAEIAEKQALQWLNGDARTAIGQAYQRACHDVAEAIRAAARPSPDAGLVERDKKIATEFFRWWWNSPGNNTDAGFDEWASGPGAVALSHRGANVAGEAVAWHDALRDAFIVGAELVHKEWVETNKRGDGPPRGNPDFSEYAGDYASSVTAATAGRDPATIEAAAKVAEQVADIDRTGDQWRLGFASGAENAANRIRALAAPAVVTGER